MSARMGSATARAPFEKPDALNAPLYRLVVDQLEAPRRWVILDLGAPSTPMLDVLSAFRSRVEIADLVGNDGIARLNTDALEGRPDASAVLPGRGEEPIDIIFCWDMLNYLSPAAVAALMREIAARARPGTLAHGLIVYSDATMPATPGRWVPDGPGRLLNRNKGGAEVKAPRYSPESLGKIMEPFAIERGVLLANGMQEFLFRLQ